MPGYRLNLYLGIFFVYWTKPTVLVYNSISKNKGDDSYDADLEKIIKANVQA